MTRQNIEKTITLDDSVNRDVAEEFVTRRNEILPEIRGELAYVLGENWREILESVPCPHSIRLERMTVDVWEIPYRIWLAKQGYQRRNDEFCRGLYYGIYKTAQIYDDGRDVDSIIADKERERQYYKELGMRFGKVIETCMRERHPELDLRLAFHNEDHYAYWDFMYKDYRGLLYGNVRYHWQTKDARFEIEKAREASTS